MSYPEYAVPPEGTSPSTSRSIDTWLLSTMKQCTGKHLIIQTKKYCFRGQLEKVESCYAEVLVGDSVLFIPLDEIEKINQK